MSSGGIGRFRGRNKPNAPEGQDSNTTHKILAPIDDTMDFEYSSLIGPPDSSEFGNFGNFNTSFDKFIPVHLSDHSSTFALDENLQAENLFINEEMNKGMNDDALIDSNQAVPWNYRNESHENNLFVTDEGNKREDALPTESGLSDGTNEIKDDKDSQLIAINHNSTHAMNAESRRSAISDTATIDGKYSEDRLSITGKGCPLIKGNQEVIQSDEKVAPKDNREPMPLNDKKLNSSLSLRHNLGVVKENSTTLSRPVLIGKSPAIGFKRSMACTKILPPKFGSQSLDSRKSSSTYLPALVTPSLHNRHESHGLKTGIPQPNTETPGTSDGASYNQRANVSSGTPFISNAHITSESSFVPNAHATDLNVQFAPKATISPFASSTNILMESRSNVSKQTDDDIMRAKPITPAPEITIKSPKPQADGKSSAKHSLSPPTREDIEVPSQSINSDLSLVSSSNTSNEDTNFEAAHSNFHDDILQVYDIQNQRHAELVNLRVRLCILEAFVLEHHSSFDDLTDEIQLLLTQFPDSYDVSI